LTVCFRHAPLSNITVQSAVTTLLPLVLIASLIKIDRARLLSSLQWLGAALALATIAFGALVNERLTLPGENTIWLGRMACIAALGALLNKRGLKLCGGSCLSACSRSFGNPVGRPSARVIGRNTRLSCPETLRRSTGAHCYRFDSRGFCASIFGYSYNFTNLGDIALSTTGDGQCGRSPSGCSSDRR
jgi:hypothetical protein